jgi:hypothetical protein
MKNSGEFESEPTLDCHAFGCPLRGTINPGGLHWYCSYHHNHSLSDFDDITLKIKQSMPMINRITDLQKDPWNENCHVYLRNEDFNKLLEENPFAYRHRLSGYVKGFILKGVTPEQQVKEEKSTSVGDIANCVTENLKANG